MGIHNAERLRTFIRDLLIRQNVSAEGAAIVADSLIQAELEGVGSHGIIRLPVYSKRIREGRINPRPTITIHKKGTSVLLADGDNGLGQIVSARGIREGIAAAGETGIAAVAVRNSNHFGCASYYGQLACNAGLASVVMTNSPSGIPPWGGKKAFFGTNPIAFGFPVKNGPDVLIDMSASVVARGKIIEAAKEGRAIPAGWAIDQNGFDTEDPDQALAGALLPAGGVKGYCLALAVEILTGILSGATYGPHVQSIYNDKAQAANVGHFFILIDIAKFMDRDRFSALLQDMLTEMKHVPKKHGVETISYPGERRAAAYQKNAAAGIPLSTELEEEIAELADHFHLPRP